MAGLIANFTISVLKGVLTFTDASTANYGGETITSRKLTINFSDGTDEEIAWPIVNGIGDTVTYTTDKDIAFIGEMELTPSVSDPSSTYIKTQNILAAGFTTDCLYKQRVTNILETDPKNILTKGGTQIELIEKISSYYDAAVSFIAISEIMSAQEAIDLAQSICNSQNCPC